MTAYCKVCRHEPDAHIPYKASQFCMSCGAHPFSQPVHDFELEIG